MKKAESNLRNHYKENFGRSEKEIVDTKRRSENFNDKLLNNIMNIRAKLLDKIRKNEVSNFNAHSNEFTNSKEENEMEV